MSYEAQNNYLAHNKLNFVDLTSRDWVVSGGAVAQGAVKPVVTRVADASVQFVTIPHLSGNGKQRDEDISIRTVCIGVLPTCWVINFNIPTHWFSDAGVSRHCTGAGWSRGRGRLRRSQTYFCNGHVQSSPEDSCFVRTQHRRTLPYTYTALPHDRIGHD